MFVDNATAVGGEKPILYPPLLDGCFQLHDAAVDGYFFLEKTVLRPALLSPPLPTTTLLFRPLVEGGADLRDCYLP